jgi:hypothetical protein
MYDILNKFKSLKLEMFHNQSVILCIVAGIIVIVVFALILIILRRRKFKKSVIINLSDGGEHSAEQLEESYKLITKRIKRAGRKYRSILFASVEPEALPVTIPTNTAISLAKSKKRCFLIDLDLGRDAVAKAFGLDAQENGLRPKAVQTEFENLWVLPGRHFTQSKQMNIKAIVEKALDRFDFTLINAPSLADSPDRRQIISTAQAAFICTKDASDISKLAELIEPSECVIIGYIQTQP